MKWPSVLIISMVFSLTATAFADALDDMASPPKKDSPLAIPVSAPRPVSVISVIAVYGSGGDLTAELADGDYLQYVKKGDMVGKLRVAEIRPDGVVMETVVKTGKGTKGGSRHYIRMRSPGVSGALPQPFMPSMPPAMLPMPMPKPMVPGAN